MAFGQAPVPYIGEAILVAGLVWFLSRSMSKGVIDTLRERLNLAIDRLKAANDEADLVRRSLDDLLLSVTSDKDARAEKATSTAQSEIRQLVQRNVQAIAFLSGESPAAPGSFSGRASKPDAPR